MKPTTVTQSQGL